MEINNSGIPEDFMEKLSPEAREYFMEEGLKAQRESLREDIINRGKTDLTEADVSLYKYPRKGCRHCHGEGRLGWDGKTGEVLLCDCMRRGALLDAAQEDLLPALDLMKLLSVPRPSHKVKQYPKSERRIARKLFKLEKKRRKSYASQINN